MFRALTKLLVIKALAVMTANFDVVRMATKMAGSPISLVGMQATNLLFLQDVIFHQPSPVMHIKDKDSNELVEKSFSF